MSGPWKTRAGMVIVATAPFAVLLLAHAWHYFPFLADDALISLRYAQRLLAGYGLTWTDGQPVEGYSNLLWILAVAFLGFFGADLVVAARVLGVVCMLSVTVLVAGCYLVRHAPRQAWFPVCLGLLFFSLNAPVAVWAIGGLETALYGALLAASIVSMYSVVELVRPGQAPARSPGAIVRLSLVLGLLCLTRPDGPLFAACAALTILLAFRPFGARPALAGSLRVLVFPAIFAGSQLVFRLLYYGEPLPNTALVKFRPSLDRAAAGWHYLQGGFKDLLPFSALAVVGLFSLLLSARTRARARYPALAAVAWSSYLLLVGGDFFPAYRHFVPLIVVFAFALVETAFLAAAWLRRRPVVLRSVAAVMLLSFIPYGATQFSAKQHARAKNERWEWQGRDLALLLKSAFAAEQPLLAVTAAGCLPYWSELPALDMMGLNDYYLPRHPPPDFGGGWVGHELGSGDYVLKANPDMIVFNVGSGPWFRSGEELDRMPEFHERYAPVKVATGQHVATVYVNRESSKVGIARTAAAITVPGYLLEGPEAIARLNERNKLVAAVSKGRPLRLAFRTAAHEAWKIEIRGSRPEAVAGDVRQEGDSIVLTLSSESEKPVEIEQVVLRAVGATARGQAESWSP